MPRSALASPFRFLSTLFQQPQRPAPAPFSPTPVSSEQLGLPVPHDLESILFQSPGFGSSQPADHGGRKRKANEDEGRPSKRACSEDRPGFEQYNTSGISESDAQGWMSSYVPSNITRTKADIERELMPPPATPQRAAKLDQQFNSIATRDSRSWQRDDDSISFVSSAMGRRKVEDMDEEAMEAARRRAAAVTLPENSGIWSSTERELFFHMAYRGFEALLPQNWMIDFDTLPISLFAHENATDPPLIQNIRGSHFRAGHALRCLFETGHDVRDRTHVSPGVRPEKILERAVKKYLLWALTDVGLRPRQKYIPVHAVVTKRNGRSTLETLEEIAARLHRLSERHHQLADVQPSIETYSPGATDGGETRILDGDASSLTLIGLVIISSVLTVVTLNSNSLAAAKEPVSQTASPPNSNSPTQSPSDFNPDKLRIIADLDFSQRDQDVWNALGVAIAAMQIRREAVKANYGFTSYNDLNIVEFDGMSSVDPRSEDEEQSDVNV